MAELRVHVAGPAATRGRAGARAGARAQGPETGLWHRPALLNLISDLLMLFAAVGLGWALVIWFVSRPLFPVRELIVQTPPAQVTEAQLEYVARTAIRGNFFTMDLEEIRAAYEKLPWVRRAEVRRRWPDAVELRLEEHQAVAYWTVSDSGDARLVNRFGEVFTAASNAQMPQFDGPQGSSGWLLARHKEFSAMLQPLGVKLVGLALSAREAWRLTLDNGMVIVLGREQERAPLKDRLARFVAAWPKLQEQVAVQVAVADLRYPSGFALTPVAGVAPATGASVKGKK